MSNWSKSLDFDFNKIMCVIFDFGFTLSSELYFNVHPPNYPHWQEIIQQMIFSDSTLVEEWMAGKMSLHEIAKILGSNIDLEVGEIVGYLKMGCKKLSFNNEVLEFSQRIRHMGIRTAVVTANMDVFTEIVVPSHRLNEKFDMIINSFDYQELDKLCLWPKVFEYFGNGIDYKNSLLIEDGKQNVLKFQSCGGYAYEYSNDKKFRLWLEEFVEV